MKAKYWLCKRKEIFFSFDSTTGKRESLHTGDREAAMKRHFDKTLADEIRAEKYTLKNNHDDFQQLAAADVPVYVARSSDPDGTLISRGYCLYISNAQGADFKDGTGRIFFASVVRQADCIL